MGRLVTQSKRDHGGGVDAAISRYGGSRIGWIDLSTGINPHPYPTPQVDLSAWTALPDSGAMQALVTAARDFWGVPDGAGLIAAPGASSLIAQIPALHPAARVCIPQPTYNEHAAAFAVHGWQPANSDAEAQVVVHPNNPDGTVWTQAKLPAPQAKLTIIDESFCDVMPGASLMELADRPGTLILKSFGKFWGLAGLRLGFAIGDESLLASLQDRLGPWAVSGPALAIGTAALNDTDWALRTRARLERDSARLDALMLSAGAKPLGGTTLFRLYDVDSAADWQDRLGHNHIWTRVFPYNERWLRLGLPAEKDWPRLEAALA